MLTYVPAAIAAEWQVIDRAGRTHAWQCPDLLERALVELQPLRRVRIARVREGSPGKSDAGGIQSGVHALQADQAAKQQARPGQQRHAQRHLCRHQSAAHTAVAADAAAAIFAQPARAGRHAKRPATEPVRRQFPSAATAPRRTPESAGRWRSRHCPPVRAEPVPPARAPRRAPAEFPAARPTSPAPGSPSTTGAPRASVPRPPRTVRPSPACANCAAPAADSPRWRTPPPAAAPPRPAAPTSKSSPYAPWNRATAPASRSSSCRTPDTQPPAAARWRSSASAPAAFPPAVLSRATLIRYRPELLTVIARRIQPHGAPHIDFTVAEVEARRHHADHGGRARGKPYASANHAFVARRTSSATSGS